jgi:hypothetical protein
MEHKTMSKSRKKDKDKLTEKSPTIELTWLRASYHLHTFAYRDPRSAFASGTALPVVSPTTVLLGLVSTLFFLGENEKAQRLLKVLHICEVMVDSPTGIIFFRAFHQLRRYETLKYGANPRFGLTKINQGTREYGLVDGLMKIYVGVPLECGEAVKQALKNLRHLGTHDSLCSLTDEVIICDKPSVEDVLYLPNKELATRGGENIVSLLSSTITVVTLSQFKKDKAVQPAIGNWYMAGGEDTELLPYAIRGYFQGTTKGKIYLKHKS